jgi:hypothetical protein
MPKAMVSTATAVKAGRLPGRAMRSGCPLGWLSCVWAFSLMSLAFGL